MGAIMAGLGRVIAEVGASMAVGGNILHETRVLTTSIVLEIRKGQFDVAIALGFVLMALSLWNYGSSHNVSAKEAEGITPENMAGIQVDLNGMILNDFNTDTISNSVCRNAGIKRS